MRPHRPLLLLALALLLQGCGAVHEDASATLARRQANCIIVLLDAAAAGHFGAYGYRRGTTPNVDALAARGVVFERVYSQSAATASSFPSFFSGLYQHTLVRRLAGNVSRRPPTLAEAFRAAGFRTAAFSESPFVSRSFAADRGFEDFVERKASEGSQGLVDDALAWLASNQQARFFLYLHLLRPHNPYTPPEEIARRFRPPGDPGTLVADTETLLRIDAERRVLAPFELDAIVWQYDANLFYGDQLVGQVVQRLEQLDLRDRTLVAVIADHGEAFGQHGRFLHNSTLYEEMLRVPFVLGLPPGIGHVSRVPAPVALVDLFPTLADLFSLEGAETDGVSLAGAIQGRAPVPPRLLFSQIGRMVAAIEPDYKYIVALGSGAEDPPQREELYFLRDDPTERHDVGAAHAEKRLALRQALAEAVGTTIAEPVTPPLSEDKRRELRALGYLE